MMTIKLFVYLSGESIIEFCIQFGVITQDLFYQEVMVRGKNVKNTPLEIAQCFSVSINELLGGGYITEYVVPPKGRKAYCLSPLTAACLKGKAAQDEIEWVIDLKKELPIIGTKRVSLEIINKFLQANELSYQYLAYLKKSGECNGNVKFSRSLSRTVEPITQECIKCDIYDLVSLNYGNDVIKCVIDNGCLTGEELETDNILIVDRKYDSKLPKERAHRHAIL